MKNPATLTPGDPVKLTAHGKTYDATFLCSNTHGCTIRSGAPMHTEYFIPWADENRWISDPVTMQAYEPYHAEDELVGALPDLE